MYKKKLTLATCFTLLRILLSPVLVVCMIKGYWFLAFFVFVLAAVSDMLDGFLARLRNEQTLLGACLDPIADKIFIISSFAALAFIKGPTASVFVIPMWFVWFVVIKEIALIIGIVILYCAGRRIDIKPTLLSKITTTLQLVFIGLLFIAYFFNYLSIYFVYCLYLVFGIVVFMTGASFLQYMYIGAYIGFLRRK